VEGVEDDRQKAWTVLQWLLIAQLLPAVLTPKASEQE
jgi:hypothetical protein